MEKYKFRGKTISGTWNYGNLAISQQKIGIVDAGAYVSNSIGLPFAYKVIPETVGQFTGLKDKINKEIYEDDIIAKFDLEDPYFRSVVVRHLGAFGYYNDASGFVAFASNWSFRWCNSRSNKILVLGNIHENPELIKEKSNKRN